MADDILHPATKPGVDRLRVLLSRVHGLPIEPPDAYDILSQEMRSVEAWAMQAKKLFVKANIPKSLETILYEACGNIQAVCDIDHDVFVEMDDPARHLYCFCRQPDFGYMLGCEVCGEFYHCPCLKITKREARKLTYICPICDLSKPVPRKGAFPSIDQLESIVLAARTLNFVPTELPLLDQILSSVRNLQYAAQQYLMKNQFHKTDVSVIKFYLRKLEGCDIMLPEVIKLRELVDQHANFSTSSEKYCICQRPATPLISMACCDECEDWFHFTCVKLTANDVRNTETYKCPVCCYKYGIAYRFGKVDIPTTYPPFIQYLTSHKGTQEKRKRKRNRSCGNSQIGSEDDIAVSSDKYTIPSHRSPALDRSILNPSSIASLLKAPHQKFCGIPKPRYDHNMLRAIPDRSAKDCKSQYQNNFPTYNYAAVPLPKQPSNQRAEASSSESEESDSTLGTGNFSAQRNLECDSRIALPGNSMNRSNLPNSSTSKYHGRILTGGSPKRSSPVPPRLASFSPAVDFKDARAARNSLENARGPVSKSSQDGKNVTDGQLRTRTQDSSLPLADTPASTRASTPSFDSSMVNIVSNVYQTVLNNSMPYPHGSLYGYAYPLAYGYPSFYASSVVPPPVAPSSSSAPSADSVSTSCAASPDLSNRPMTPEGTAAVGSSVQSQPFVSSWPSFSPYFHYSTAPTVGNVAAAHSASINSLSPQPSKP
jgi:hypothetical protein